MDEMYKKYLEDNVKVVICKGDVKIYDKNR